MTIACIDVLYDEQLGTANAACVTFNDWSDRWPTDEIVQTIDQIEPYVPGQFYKRELPCISVLLDLLPSPPETIVVDGYVWLDENLAPGLGGHLYERLARKAIVVGIAKTHFAKANIAIEVHRGKSKRPLYVTAAGMDANLAAECVRDMHGENRIPTLLKRVDQLSRS